MLSQAHIFPIRLAYGLAEPASTQAGSSTPTNTSSLSMNDQKTSNIAASRLRRLGFDNMCGFLCGGMNEWQEAGKPIRSFGTMSANELKMKLEKQEVLLLDVRDPPEWEEDGYVEGANLIFFADLAEKADSLPKDKAIAVTCSVGKRSSIGASILERKGFENISNVLGGMTAWTNLGYPVINK